MSTTTTTSRDRDQALTWAARQLRWERTLTALRKGRAPRPATPERRAA
jgi:hypothetical protein